MDAGGEVKKSKIEREIDEYCGEGLNEHEDEDEKVPVATYRLLLKLREENFFVPTANRAFIKTCNTFLVNILKAISSCVKAPTLLPMLMTRFGAKVSLTHTRSDIKKRCASAT
jgi:hypothetical protein